MKQTELQNRMLRLTDNYPDLLPLFCRLIELVDESNIEEHDIDVVLRLCQTQPDIVYLLLGMMEIVRSSEEVPVFMQQIKG